MYSKWHCLFSLKPTVEYCTVHYSTVQYCTTTVLEVKNSIKNKIQYSIAPYNTVCTVMCCSVLDSIVLYFTSTVQYSTVPVVQYYYVTSTVPY